MIRKHDFNVAYAPEKMLFIATFKPLGIEVQEDNKYQALVRVSRRVRTLVTKAKVPVYDHDARVHEVCKDLVDDPFFSDAGPRR